MEFAQGGAPPDALNVIITAVQGCVEEIVALAEIEPAVLCTWSSRARSLLPVAGERKVYPLPADQVMPAPPSCVNRPTINSPLAVVVTDGDVGVVEAPNVPAD